MTTQLPGRRYSAFSALFLAPFFSGELSRDVGRNWRGIGFWFLILILLITWTAELVQFKSIVSKSIREDLPQFADQIPPITIEDGVVSSPVPQPHEIRNPTTGDVLVRLDTTGATSSIAVSGAMMLITRDSIHFHDKSTGRVTTRSLAGVKHLHFDGPMITRGAAWFDKWYYAILLPPCLILTLLWRLFMGAIYALVGLVFSSMFNAHLSFGALMRLAAIAVWPMLLLETAVSLAHVQSPRPCASLLIQVAIVLIYLFVAVKANELPADYFASQYFGTAPLTPSPGGPFPNLLQAYPQAPPRPTERRR